MKEGFDKEMDSLLRRRARGVAAESFADGDGVGSSASAHLDADELGAFAEGALPAPARLAAVSHLADCDRCRGVAVTLSRSLGGGAEPKQAAAAVPASVAAEKPAAWRAWAAALFSPRALRFAVPALALSVVAVVSYVALRTRDGGALDNTQSARPQSEVAQVRPGEDAPATAATTANATQEGLVAPNTGESSGNRNTSAAAPRPSPEARGPNAGEPAPVAVDAVTVTAGDTAAPPPPPSAPAASPEAPPEIARSAPKTAAVEEPEQPSKSEDRDKAKSARDAGNEVAENEYSTNQRGRDARNRAGEVQMPDGGSRAQKRADNNVSNIYGNNAGVSAAPKETEREARGGGATASRRAARPNTRAEQKAEVDDETVRVGDTREAAGHRFRREGSAWVDVKYKPSMRSTGVRRGSEAFRALVADVPVVGRVAQQISGEVIVVVGGQAYRIR